MRFYGKIVCFLVCICLGFSSALLAQANVPAFTWNKTATGFYWPTGVAIDPGIIVYGGTWLGRDAAHDWDGYPPYFDGQYHLGYDIPANYGDPVFAVSSGVVLDTPSSGWGTGNVAVLVVHTLANGTQFVGVYGHVHTNLKKDDVVTAGGQIATIGAYSITHLHFGIRPGNTVSGNIAIGFNPNWPDSVSPQQVLANPQAYPGITNGMVDPIAWIKNQTPACGNGSSQFYKPNGQIPIHPNGTIVKVKGTGNGNDQVYVLSGAQRLAIPDQYQLNRLYGEGRGFDFRDVITISREEMNQYEDGGIVGGPLPDNGKNEPNGRIIRQWGGSEFSIVTEYGGVNGVRIPFESGSHFFNLGYAECNIAGVSDYGSYTVPSGTTMENMNRGITIAGFGDPSYSTSAMASPNSPSINQAINITGLVSNNIGTANDKIVDIEIYDASGTRMQQTFFEGQYFTVGAAATEYPITWTASTSGTYKVSIGVFNSDWSELENWNDNALSLTVGAPPTGYVIDIWWPTDGSTQSGTQPFKALLENYDLSQYNMFWQVDGGQLNPMSDNQTDWPHKEVSVDLSGWTWRGAGPYNVNFVAKDQNGNVLAQRSVNITVVQ